ncbi:MAG: hypothetical protein R3F46_00570 [bacterium]
MDAVTDSRPAGGFISEWKAAIQGLDENPVAGWLMTARERRTQKLPWIRRILGPLLISLVFTVSFLYGQRSNSLISSTGTIQLLTMFISVSVLPAVFFWAITGVFTAIQEAMSLLADENRSRTSLTIDDMVSVSSMSNADIAAGALQVIMPQLFWRSLAVSLSFWWLMLMLTSLFGQDLRAESFINTWIWGIVTVPLMTGSSLLASLAIVLGCIAAGLHSRGMLVPLTAAVLGMLGTLVWSIAGSYMMINDQQVLFTTRAESIYGSVAFIALALIVALMMRGSSRSRAGTAILIPMLGLICCYIFFRVLLPREASLSEQLLSSGAGFIRSWGSLSLINPLFVPTAASWGDSFGGNPATSEQVFRNGLEMRWIIGFLTQLALVWINAWLAWSSIRTKRSGH